MSVIHTTTHGTTLSLSVSADNGVNCERCHRKTNTLRSIKITTAPEVINKRIEQSKPKTVFPSNYFSPQTLILHLKRFKITRLKNTGEDLMS